MKLEIAARQALEALESIRLYDEANWRTVYETITALREALAEQAEQEPIRFVWNGEGWIEADDYIWKTTDDHERRELYAEPVQEPSISDGLCGGCAKKSADGWALYCVECWEKGNGQSASNEPAANAHVSNADSDILSDVKQEPVASGYVYAENLAKNRYKVVPSHPSMFHGFAVTAGDGEQHLYVSRKADCENVARNLTCAFLDGAYAATKLYSAPVRTKDLTDDEIGEACCFETTNPAFRTIVGLARAVIAADREKNK